MMLYFRSCPRCKTGTIKFESDFFGNYLSCLNCGFQKNAASLRRMEFAVSSEEGAAVAAPAGLTPMGMSSGSGKGAVEDAGGGDFLAEPEFFSEEDDQDLDELRGLERATG